MYRTHDRRSGMTLMELMCCLAIIAIIAAMYLLPALQRVIYNPLDKPANEKLPDLSPRELAVLVPLIACILWIGVYPQPILRRIEPASRQLIQTVRLNAASFSAAR